VRAALTELPEGGDTDAVAARFKSARRKSVEEILNTLVGLGQANRDDSGIYRL